MVGQTNPNNLSYKMHYDPRPGDKKYDARCNLKMGFHFDQLPSLPFWSDYPLSKDKPRHRMPVCYFSSNTEQITQYYIVQVMCETFDVYIVY